MENFGNLYIIAAKSVISDTVFGFDISLVSAIIATTPYKSQYNAQVGSSLSMSSVLSRRPLKTHQGNDHVTGQCRGPNASLQGGIAAAISGGSWFSAPSLDGDQIALDGRRLFKVVGSIIFAALVDEPMLIVGHIINGFSRDRFISMQQWAITWGIAFMFFLRYGYSFIKGEAAFRFPWGL
ncbi:hypothetical protein HD806DRAFT_532069 [Xylariaceae sp. AK1471]|nr:hypothetical protein HD806DRAFT_532069 [Xylariaceae sp. AK1471]